MPLDILSSLPRDLIRTNRAPNETELASARAMLPYFEDEISGISAQIEEAEARLRKLNSARRTLQRKEARLKSVVAPIRRVPQDVICLIFDYCLCECCVLEDNLEGFWSSDIFRRHGFKNFLPSLSARRLPLLLTHVSSGFRKIVLVMPTLWKIAEFHIQSPSKTWTHHDSDHYKHVCISQRNRISGMKEWLRHSGSLPLNLEVHFYNSPHYTYEELQELYNGMIDIVISCHTRWRDIRFSFDQDLPEKMMSALLALTSEDLPLLRTLRFHSYEYTGSSQYFKFMPMFACPSLKTLTGVLLDDSHIHKDLLRSSFSNLTLLDACIEIRSLTIATTLRQCTSLIQLRLFITGDNDDITFPQFVIELPCLQELYVIDDLPVPEGEQYSMKTIKYISAPNLNKFYYKKQWSEITMLPDVFKCSHNVTTLGLAGDISCDIFIEILRYCPQITCLDGLPNLTHSGLGLAVAYDRFLIRLVDADDAGDTICPKLERMYGGYDPIPIINVNTLDAIVTRKSMDSSANMAPWRMLRAKITCMQKDETTVQKLLRKCNRNIFFLILCGTYDTIDDYVPIPFPA